MRSPTASERLRLLGAKGALDLAAERARQRPAGIEEAIVSGRLGEDGAKRGAERGVARRDAVDVRRTLVGRERQRAVDQLVGLRPFRQVDHARRPSPASSSRSHARALNHSRCAVRGEMPSASAVSPSVSPAKYRHSTTLRHPLVDGGELSQRQIDLQHVLGVRECLARWPRRAERSADRRRVSGAPGGGRDR